jgi:hypothetical protein
MVWITFIGEIGKTLKLQPEDIKELKEVAKLRGADDALLESYSLDSVLSEIKALVLLLLVVNLFRLEKGIFEAQLAKDVINLPDTRAFNQAVVGYKTNLPLLW